MFGQSLRQMDILVTRKLPVTFNYVGIFNDDSDLYKWADCLQNQTRITCPRPLPIVQVHVLHIILNVQLVPSYVQS